MRGGSHVDASARGGVGNFGISMFHRAAASSLNQLPGNCILLLEQFVVPSVFATDSAQTSARIVILF